MHIVFGILLLLIGVLLAVATIAGVLQLLSEGWLTAMGVLTMPFSIVFAFSSCFVWFRNPSWNSFWLSMSGFLTILMIGFIFTKGTSPIKTFLVNLIGLSGLGFLSFFSFTAGLRVL